MKGRVGITHDESEGWGRPPRRTRPRTKDRPDFSDAAVATVRTVDRGRYRRMLDAGRGPRGDWL